MVKDMRAPSGWVFGTFQYNGGIEVAAEARWDRLVPVGMMWGNDPGITDSASQNADMNETRINKELQETVINPDQSELPATHLGWNGRLNGPVDNGMSSCMSCHQTAQYPTKSPLSPLFLPVKDRPMRGSPQWMRWFRNIACTDAFDPGMMSTDGSLQLSMAVQNFYDWVNNMGGIDARSYNWRTAIQVSDSDATSLPVITDPFEKPISQPIQR
jgi:hypothetical protein